MEELKNKKKYKYTVRNKEQNLEKKTTTKSYRDVDSKTLLAGRPSELTL